MKMAIKYFVKAPVSEYTDQSGAVKKRYQNIGIIMETKKGDLMVKLELIPFKAIEDGALVGFLNTPEEVEASKNYGKAAAPKNDAPDDIPF
jgi:hypothetical protein